MNPLSSIFAFFKGLRALIMGERTGINFGITADYPRVEIHSILEGERQDKDGNLREITCTVECLSTESMTSVLDMNAENLSRAITSALSLEGNWTVIDIIPGQGQVMPEVSDTNKVLYRLLQEVRAFIDYVPETETEEDSEETE